MKRNTTLTVLSAIIIISILSCTSEPSKIAISKDGVKISYNEQGKGKPTLVLVHGWTNDKTIWNGQVELLSDKYRVVTVDIAGHGESGDNRENWTMSAFGDDVAAVINKLNLEEVILVGFSLGGPIIVETANKIPDVVKGLIFVDTIQNPDVHYSPEAIEGMKGFFMNSVINPSKDGLAGVFFKRNIDEAYEMVLEMFDGPSRLGWEESLDEYFRWRNEDGIKLLKTIQAPIVAINSDAEPTNVEAFNKYVPSFKVKIMEDVGHVVFWDSPEEFSDHIKNSVNEML